MHLQPFSATIHLSLPDGAKGGFSCDIRQTHQPLLPALRSDAADRSGDADCGGLFTAHHPGAVSAGR